MRTIEQAGKLLDYIKKRQSRPGAIANRLGDRKNIWHTHTRYPHSQVSLWGLKPKIKNPALYNAEKKEIPTSSIERTQPIVNYKKVKGLLKLAKQGRFDPSKANIPSIAQGGKHHQFDGHHTAFAMRLLGHKSVPSTVYTPKTLK